MVEVAESAGARNGHNRFRRQAACGPSRARRQRTRPLNERARASVGISVGQPWKELLAPRDEDQRRGDRFVSTASRRVCMRS